MLWMPWQLLPGRSKVFMECARDFVISDLCEVSVESHL